ncbi:putative Phosphatidylglycerol specific phospholipase C [Mycena sanguinolenta]|uniref:Putative Phosphatidylglycerol specific phospholipase C n=1 Tax=Mycena sanguinolenta TaxID=230812 RepID=A0A8H6ZBE5_9AGAR|nr:putative Phosphatidylglycerol specific phospholipase C [Mycena sanguinolenta]
MKANSTLLGLLATSTSILDNVNLFGSRATTSTIPTTVTPAPFGYTAGSPESVANLKDKIKHVIWVLLENRSFDNILGAVKRPGFDNPANNGDVCNPSGKITATNQGFIEKQLIYFSSITPDLAASQVMGYYSEQEIPTLLDICDDFTTFNYWFSCIPGPTNPNRACALSGTSDGHGSNDNNFNIANISVNSIFETASSKNISWLNYDGTNGAFAPDALFYPWTAANAKSNVVPIENFFQDAYLGTLPQLSYLNPSCCDKNTNSMHPSGNVSFGQVFVKQIYDAVRQGPHWSDTLLLVTYDESGGFHDHVPSPLAVPPDNKTYTETAHDGEVYTFHFDRLGGRMPTWLISSYTPKGHLESMGTNPATGAVEAYSATSVLKTLGLLWDFEDFTPRVSNSPSFDHLIGPTMRQDAPLILTPPLPFPNDT